MKSLGLIEVSGVTAAIDCLDIMCKSADVEFVTWERKLGGRLVTVVVEGQVSAVTAAVDNAMANAIKKPVSHAVIASPHEEVQRLLELSASRMKKKEGTK
ncbi:MAG: BMC domain-containing protein [Clostridia bacterium]|nr:BMC domain-containing protein [Clostridia bacterium]